MGCCGSSEKSDLIKKDKKQLKSECSNNVIANEKPLTPREGTRNKVQPLQEDDKSTLFDSKLALQKRKLYENTLLALVFEQ